MRYFGKIIAVLMVVATSGALALAQTGHSTSLKFDKVVHNFGKILAGSGEKKCQFKYTNVSSEPTGGAFSLRCAKSALVTTAPLTPGFVATDAIMGGPCITRPSGRKSSVIWATDDPPGTGTAFRSRPAMATDCRSFDATSDLMNTTVPTASATPSTAQTCRAFTCRSPGTVRRRARDRPSGRAMRQLGRP